MARSRISEPPYLQVAAVVQDMILSGRIQAGITLHVSDVAEMARMAGVSDSHSAASKAIVALVERGMLVYGDQVAPSVRMIDPGDLPELAQRVHWVCGQALKSLRRTSIELVQVHPLDMLNTVAGLTALDVRFHRQLVEASHQPWLLAQFEAVAYAWQMGTVELNASLSRSIMEVYWRFLSAELLGCQATLAEHRLAEHFDQVARLAAPPERGLCPGDLLGGVIPG